MTNNETGKYATENKYELFVSLVANMKYSNDADDSIDTINRLIQRGSGTSLKIDRPGN